MHLPRPQHTHQLRDERQRGKITASKIVGGRIRYTREDLVQYLLTHRTDGRGDSE